MIEEQKTVTTTESKLDYIVRHIKKSKKDEKRLGFFILGVIVGVLVGITMVIV